MARWIAGIDVHKRMLAVVVACVLLLRALQARWPILRSR